MIVWGPALGLDVSHSHWDSLYSKCRFAGFAGEIQCIMFSVKAWALSRTSSSNRSRPFSQAPVLQGTPPTMSYEITSWGGVGQTGNTRVTWTSHTLRVGNSCGPSLEEWREDGPTLRRFLDDSQSSYACITTFTPRWLGWRTYLQLSTVHQAGSQACITTPTPRWLGY